mmetsp:Transcript_38181/g.36540  ORF Transcript_38181/g.36540 Transcript_38181/m.36540 type:complete len:181 (+) Transcript_38181:175-717(+)
MNDRKVMALVIRTGFTTIKGSLVRDILYPRPTKFKFYRDSLLFIAAMAVLAVLGFVCILPLQIQHGFKVIEIIDRSLDMITITVPPALPAAMTIGIVYSMARLKKRLIFCISPERVNIAGRVNLMVFDKTGTLTEDGLQVTGFRAAQLDPLSKVVTFGEFSAECRHYQPTNQWWNDLEQH